MHTQPTNPAFPIPEDSRGLDTSVSNAEVRTTAEGSSSKRVRHPISESLPNRSRCSRCCDTSYVFWHTALQFMESDTVAIVGPQSSVVAHIISHVANELQVPLLSFAATDPALSNLQFPYSVRTTQSDLHQMTAVDEIVDYYTWREVIAIFIDNDYRRMEC